mgnify:FL=1|jgi:hypothetical protein
MDNTKNTSHLNMFNLVTLDDDKKYLVVNTIKVDNNNYVLLVEENNVNNSKLLEEVLVDGELILREVLDEIKLEKIKLQVLKNSAEILKKLKSENIV